MIIDVNGNVANTDPNKQSLQSPIDPVATAAAKKLETINQPTVLQPLVTPTYQAPSYTSGTSKPQSGATLQDFIDEAQKLGKSSFQSQADILSQNQDKLVSDLSRGLYSQNVGASSGVGQQVLQQVAKERAQTLAPYAEKTATDVALQTLGYQQQEAQQTQARQDQAFNMILSGQLDKSQFTPQDWAKYGVTDPNAIKTVQQMDFSTAMQAQGMDPNNPADQATYRTQLQNSAKNNLKQQIIGWYSAANDGQVPTPDEINMMMLYYGQGTGMLTNEEQTALINQYNTQSWDAKMDRARQQAAASKAKIICTELHRQGLMSDSTYLADQAYGRSLDDITYLGYVTWAQYVVAMMKKSRIVTRIAYVIATPWAKQMEHVMSGIGNGSLLGRFMMVTGENICYLIGKAVRYGNTRRLTRTEA